MYSLVPLIERPDLARKCIELLNEEWPRSDGSREYSQSKSTRDRPPMSLILIEEKTDQLVAHVRVCLLPGRTTTCWFESVIVSKQHRRKGLGKKVMLAAEQFLKEKFGFVEAFLSTEDQVDFYRSCGYVECAPIIHSTVATSVFPIFEKLNLNVERSNVVEKKDASTSTSPLSSSSPISLSLSDDTPSPIRDTAAPICTTAPPPPPPPPVAGKSPKGAPGPKTISTVDHQYMRKKF